jgi:aminoglycoside 6'-N-acetyltransferase I
VDADQRQRGIGGQLVAMAESWARDCGLVEMASDCLIDNLISISAHNSLGYQEMERLVHFCKRL